MNNADIHGLVLKCIISEDFIDISLFTQYMIRLQIHDSLASLPKLLYTICTFPPKLEISDLVTCIRKAELQPHVEDIIFFSFVMYTIPVQKVSMAVNDVQWVKDILFRVSSFRRQILQGISGRINSPPTEVDIIYMKELTSYMTISKQDIESAIVLALPENRRTALLKDVILKVIRIV